MKCLQKVPNVSKEFSKVLKGFQGFVKGLPMVLEMFQEVSIGFPKGF